MAQRKARGRVKVNDAMTPRVEKAKAELADIAAKVAAAKAELLATEIAKRDAAKDFAPGDKVQLNVGSPAMTVIGATTNPIAKTRVVNVLYASDGEIVERHLDARTLIKANALDGDRIFIGRASDLRRRPLTWRIVDDMEHAQ